LDRIEDDGYENGVRSMKIGRQKENKKANGRHEKRKVYM
jgi:hypothetical protein